MNSACTLLQRKTSTKIERSAVPVFLRLAEAWLAKEQGRVHTEGERQWLLVEGQLHPIKLVLGPQS